MEKRKKDEEKLIIQKIKGIGYRRNINEKEKVMKKKKKSEIG